MGRKHWGKRRNFLLQAISPFPTVFEKDLNCRHVKTRDVWEKVKLVSYLINPFLHIYSSLCIEEKSFRKTLWKKMKVLKMTNFTFFHNVFYAIYILKSLNSHISVVVCSIFEFGTVTKWCIRELVNLTWMVVGCWVFAFNILENNSIFIAFEMSGEQHNFQCIWNEWRTTQFSFEMSRELHNFQCIWNEWRTTQFSMHLKWGTA